MWNAEEEEEEEEAVLLAYVVDLPDHYPHGSYC